MDLLQRLQLDLAQEQMICIAGSGGKTSLLYYLGRRCFAQGIRAALLTTTHIRPPEEARFPLVQNSQAAAEAWERGLVPVLGTPQPDGKLGPPDPRLMESLSGQGFLLLVEVDGSRGLPVKFPNATEPVLPSQASRVITVAGLSALGKPLREVCHRWELACQALASSPDQKVTPPLLAALLVRGYGKYHPTVLLNQIDTVQPEDWQLVAALLCQGGIGTVAAASLRQEELLC